MSEEVDPLDEAVDVISLAISKLPQERIQKIIHDILTKACNGQVDGGHHKAHSIDQIVRIITDCPKVKVDAKSCSGEPYSYEKLGESPFYQMFVKAYEGCVTDEDGFTEKEYEWDTGIPA